MSLAVVVHPADAEAAIPRPSADDQVLLRDPVQRSPAHERHETVLPRQPLGRRLILLATFRADPADESLGEDALQRRGDQIRLDPHVLHPRDRAGGVIRVQRAENKVPRQRRVDRDVGGVLVSDLTDHNDVGVVPDDRAKTGREAQADLVVDVNLIHALEPDFHFKPEIELYNLVEDPDGNRNVAGKYPDIVAGLKSEMDAYIAKREGETGNANPIGNQPGWHGTKGIDYFTSSKQAYDTLHIGDPKMAAKLQAESRK